MSVWTTNHSERTSFKESVARRVMRRAAGGLPEPLGVAFHVLFRALKFPWEPRRLATASGLVREAGIVQL